MVKCRNGFVFSQDIRERKEIKGSGMCKGNKGITWCWNSQESEGPLDAWLSCIRENFIFHSRFTQISEKRTNEPRVLPHFWTWIICSG